MAYWLMKSEPSVYGWEQLVKDGGTHWNGVRNYQASNNLKAMAIGDEAFFYHSNDQRAIVGIMRITRIYYPDPSDERGRFGMVDVAPVRPCVQPVTLAVIKATPGFADFALVRHSRLSVLPVTPSEWQDIIALSQPTR